MVTCLPVFEWKSYAMSYCIVLLQCVYHVCDLMKVGVYVRSPREAVCLARVRLSPSDPVLRKLFTSWASLLSKDGNYELAAKWYCCCRPAL